jgi:peptide/nickel transport system substrate-binding protein
MDERPVRARVTRRDVLATGTAALACGFVPRRAAAQSAKVLRVAVAETRDPLDPAVYYTSSDMILPLNTQEGLVRSRMGTYEVEPSLAESWEVRDRGRTFIFRLREGVRFHDGTLFNAEAARFEIERAMKVAQGGTWMLTDFVDRVVVEGEHRLTLHLRRAMPGYLHYLAGPWAIRFQSPTAYRANEKDGDLGRAWAVTHVAGTGPYRLESYEKESRVILARHDAYWRGWKRPHIERVVVNVIKEPTTVRLQLEAGDLDMSFVQLKPVDYEALARNPGIALSRQPSGAQVTLTLKCNQPPSDSKLVRQALNHAFNYDQVITRIYGGNAQRIGPQCLGLEGDSPRWHTYYRYDLERARTLLAQAGHPRGGLHLKAIYRSGVDIKHRLTLELFQADLRKLNVDLELVEMAGAPWRERIRDPKADWNMMWRNWVPDVVDAAGAMFPVYKCAGHLEPASINRSRWCNETVDALFQRTFEEPDARRRIANLQQAMELVLEGAPAIWMFWPQDIFPYRRTIRNFGYNGYYTPSSTRFYDLEKEA